MIIYIFLNSFQFNNSNANNWSSTLEMLGQFLFLIVVFSIVIFLTFYSTKFIAKVKMKSNKNNNLKIIESIQVGFGQYIMLIKAGDKYLVISVTKDKINFIAQLDNDSVKEEQADKQIEDTLFEKCLKDIFQKLNKKK